jgi:histidine triad (HIT) family protein
MEDCIFCKIIKGDIPSKTVYEDDIVKVFLDVNPNTDGHMLVVPKKHITDFTEMDDETLTHIHHVIKNMKELIYDKLGAIGLKIVNNYGVEQLVKHYHIHLIPVYEEGSFEYKYADASKIDEVFEKLTK